MSQRFHCRVYVTLRPSVLDPAGTAVERGLHQLGYGSVKQVRIGKYIELELQAPTLVEAQQMLDSMGNQLLANTVIENYRFEVLPAGGEE